MRMEPSRRARVLRRSVVATLALALGVAGGFVCWRWMSGNVGTVVPAQVYRSAQLSPSGQKRVIEQYRIKTVLNLRGCNPELGWYRAERTATLAAGATQVDVPLASDQWLSRAQARTLVDVLATCERPLLIHCEWGAERTGLVSALAALMQQGVSVSEARGQFSPYYLFAPVRHGLVMRGHIDAYNAWLQAQGRSHSADSLRTWLTQAYRPRRPSREYWPYQPYPLVVVTRPTAAHGELAGAVGAKALR